MLLPGLVHPGEFPVELLRHGFEAPLLRRVAVALVGHEAFHVFGEADLPMDLGLLATAPLAQKLGTSTKFKPEQSLTYHDLS